MARVSTDRRLKLPPSWRSRHGVGKGSWVSLRVVRGVLIVAPPSVRAKDVPFRAFLDDRLRIRIPYWQWEALGWKERSDLHFEDKGDMLLVRVGHSLFRPELDGRKETSAHAPATEG